MTAGTAPSPARRPLTEYQTRLRMGLVMAVAAGGVLVVDHLLQAWYGWRFYPCLLVCVLGLTVLGVLELHAMLASTPRPPRWLSVVACVALVLTSWTVHLDLPGAPDDPWRALSWVFTGILLTGFAWEMATYREPGGVVQRMAMLTFIAGYLGLLPSYFVQLRWSTAGAGDLGGVAALALVIFVPKCCDIGAYFTGRLIGRHPMTPRLSPKKTWEGLAGGLTLAVVVAVLLNRLVAPVLRCDLEAAAFGAVIGMMGVLGDLGESLIKRDCGQKDASQVVPGFGGVLDVVDSVLFAAPVAYWWLRG